MPLQRRASGGRRGLSTRTDVHRDTSFVSVEAGASRGSKPLITSNVIHRCFRIRCGSSFGTGFAVDVNYRQYLVTAKHVVAGGNPPFLEIYRSGGWRKINSTLVGHAAEEDVSVFALDGTVVPEGLPMLSGSDGISYGQDVYFLGFPYGVLSNVVLGEEGYPLPLVKRAVVSGFKGRVLLLDGHNNPGFSGGPVIFGRAGRTPDCFGAIISGYRFDPRPVYVNNQESGLTTRSNTGIIISYSMDVALGLIDGNPVGPPV
jgi:S1-C subfamily serine protease